LDLFAPSLLDDVLDDVTSDVADTDEEEPVRRVLLNEYLLLAGWVRRYDEDWVEPLSLEADLIAAERLAQVRQQGLWGRCAE
jgi:endonuclease YncB( thermonuclease family)